MSILIDQLLYEHTNKNEGTNVQINGKWYIAKPYPYIGLKTILYRLKEAWKVLIGKAECYHYKEDE